MRARFSLYGFLKNQRYFEPFLVLVFLEQGCDFTQVGILVAIREIVMQAFEIPSGAVADVLGRRRAMVLAFCAYVAAYLLLGVLTGFAWLGVGMALLGFGDAFRSGTHKAMIFAWLRSQGRADEKVQFYGYTRSWSKIGSVVAIPIAAAVVLSTGRFAPVFLLSAIPATADLVNLATYPRELDGDPDREPASVRGVIDHLIGAMRRVWSDRPLRRLVAEGMAFGGAYKSVKDYLQPLLVAAAATLPWLAMSPDKTRTALTAGVVYMALFGLGATASRHAHRWVAWFESPGRAASALWWVVVVVLAGLLGALLGGWLWAAVAGFVLLGALQDLFRPALVSRIDDTGAAEAEATTLSLESQARSAMTIVLAPLVGWAVDFTTAGATSPTLWPVAAVALAIALPMALRR